MFPVPVNLQLESVRTNIGVAKLQITEKLEAIEGQVAAVTENRELSSTDKDVKELSDKVATLTAKVAALEEERNLWLGMAGDEVVHVYGKTGGKYHKTKTCISCGNSKCVPTALPRKLAIDLEFGACQRCYT